MNRSARIGRAGQSTARPQPVEPRFKGAAGRADTSLEPSNRALPRQRQVMTVRRQVWVTAAILAVTFFGIATMSLAAPQGAHAEAPLVFIDPGHGGPYSNANANGLREKTVNLQIALQLGRRLRSMGYRVVLARTTDRAIMRADIPTWNWSDALGRWTYANDGRRGYVGGIPKDDLQARVDLANALGADLFISIHNNGGGRSARGTETWASSRDPRGVQLSKLVQKAVVKRTALRNRGAFKKDFYVLRWSNMPALLVEGAFISNARDARLLRTFSGRRRVAWGIADGVAAWFATRSTAPVYPRTSAANAIQLAARVSASDVPSGAPAAVVASTANTETVLVASTLAATLRGPLLLASTDNTPGVLPTATEIELARLRPKRLVLAGITGAFTSSLIDRLAAAAALPASSVEVVQGADASELSVAMARLGRATSAEVALARTGDADAVAQAARSASAVRAPLLLVPNQSMPATATAYFAERGTAVTSVRVFGAPTSIPDAALTGLPGVRRVARAERFRMAANELYRIYSSRAWGSLRPIVVDANDASSLAVANTRSARSGQPVVLVSGRVLSPWTREWITNNRGPIGGFQLIGQAGSLPLLVEWMLAKAECS